MNNILNFIKSTWTTWREISWIEFQAFFKNIQRVIVVSSFFALFFFTVDNIIIKLLKTLFS